MDYTDCGTSATQWVGARLRKELKGRGMSQLQLAKAIGMQPSHLSEIINGKRTVTKDTADKFASVLGTSSIEWMNLQTKQRYGLPYSSRLVDGYSCYEEDCKRILSDLSIKYKGAGRGYGIMEWQDFDYNNLQALILGNESRTLELKRTTGELNKGMESACAFLNTDGGWLIFGVTPDLKIEGQNVSDSTKQEIANAIRKIEPAIDINVEYIEIPHKPGFFVIAIYFSSTDFRYGPYTFNGRPYYKLESTTAVMPREMYDQRLRLSDPKRFSWEDRPNRRLTISDIDTELVYQVLHDGIGARRIHASAMTIQDPMKMLIKLGVATTDGGLLNAANVLFGNDPTMHNIQCKVRLARFEGTDKRYFRDQTVCEGNLFEQYDAVVDFCLKHLNLAGRMDGKFRKDTLTVPYDAIKEATVNMLCHRSWDSAGSTPSLAIYDDRMVFQNPGAFPKGMTWQDFADNQIGSLPANPTIANVFYRRGMMEAWGRGMNLIMESCTSEGLPRPEVQTNPYFVTLTIRFRKALTRTTSPHPLHSENTQTAGSPQNVSPDQNVNLYGRWPKLSPV